MEKVSGVLKAFVIGAGIVLFAGTILLVTLIVLRITGGREVALPPAAQAVDLQLPAGARIEQVVPDGVRVLLLGTDRTGAQFLAVVDPATGERLMLVRVRPDG